MLRRSRPLLTFNPAFTLLVAWFSLAEVPGVRQTIGVAVVLFGAYLLEVEEARIGFLAPLRVLVRRPGALLAMVASALWGTTTVLEKLAIAQLSPPNGPVVALLGTFPLVLLLTPGAFRSSGNEATPARQNRWKGLRAQSIRPCDFRAHCRHCPALWLHGDCAWPGRICHHALQAGCCPDDPLGMGVSRRRPDQKPTAWGQCHAGWRRACGPIVAPYDERGSFCSCVCVPCWIDSSQENGPIHTGARDEAASALPLYP